MKVTVIGTGYIGLVSGTCLAELGNHVVCLDSDVEKIRVLAAGGLPIHEPGLLEIVSRNVTAGRLQFTTDAAASVNHGTLRFIAAGTPPDEDGSADLRHVLAAARDIGRHITDYRPAIDKSTVPVGTADKVKPVVAAELAACGAVVDFAVVSNPEFLKEGAAVEDFMRPDRIVVGADDERAVLLMRALGAPYIRNHDRLLVMDIRSAEFTKYAAKCRPATHISLMNEMALLTEKGGADIEAVRKGLGSDPRVGYQFLYAGTGYGGSCFPNEDQALFRAGGSNDVDLQALQAVGAVNARQELVLIEKVLTLYGANLGGRTFAIGRLALKPNTDSMREAHSRVIVAELLHHCALVLDNDPVAGDDAWHAFGEKPGLLLVDNAAAALMWRRRGAHNHRAEEIQESGLGRDAGEAAAVGSPQRAQSLRPAANGDFGYRLPRRRPRRAVICARPRRASAPVLCDQPYIHIGRFTL